LELKPLKYFRALYLCLSYVSEFQYVALTGIILLIMSKGTESGRC